MTVATSPNLPYQPALDGLRALAVTGVIAGHLGVPHTADSGIGVYVFFVLSGYLITTLLLDEVFAAGAVQLGRFYARRALRLLPALFLLVAATLLYIALFSHDGRVNSVSLRGTPAVLLYYANWVQVDGKDSLGFFFHFWSLAVEEQFYLLWPLGLSWLMRHRWRGDALAWLLAAGLTFVLAMRLFSYQSLGDVRLLVGTHLVADQLLAGCLLAVLLHGAHRGIAVARFVRRLTVPAVAYLLAFAVLTSPGGTTFVRQRALFTLGVTGVALASAVVIARLVTSPASLPARVLAAPVLVYLGRISYGMYLWHVLVLYALVEHAPSLGRGVAWWVLSYVLTVAAASVSYALVERRALLLKRRFRPRLS